MCCEHFYMLYSLLYMRDRSANKQANTDKWLDQSWVIEQQQDSNIWRDEHLKSLYYDSKKALSFHFILRAKNAQFLISTAT